ncbi:MAG: HAMP domain-containing histidine kinase [Chitinophagales bacterium]|nr:HAMP domain-containing histidine kinase [Chitinophagales bacterium]
MRFMYTVDAIPVLEQDFPLHLMINRLIISTMPLASRQQCIIVNEVKPGFCVEADEKKLLAVTGHLLNAVIAHSKNCSLAVSAKKIGHVILLHVKVNNRLYSRPFAEKLAGIQEMALKAGASVSVTSFRNNITTLAIGFMNHNSTN